MCVINCGLVDGLMVMLGNWFVFCILFLFCCCIMCDMFGVEEFEGYDGYFGFWLLMVLVWFYGLICLYGSEGG